MKLPDIKTEKGATQFWETHSIADYWEDLEESPFSSLYYPKRSECVPVRVR